MERCPKCYFVMCQCTCGRTPRKPPPNVINFDGRSPEARIASLERVVVGLEVSLEAHITIAARRAADLEVRLVAIEERHIELLDCLIKHFTL